MTPAELELIDLLESRIDLLWDYEVSDNDTEKRVIKHRMRLVDDKIKKLRKL